jgi:hypothetical protein
MTYRQSQSHERRLADPPKLSEKAVDCGATFDA